MPTDLPPHLAELAAQLGSLIAPPAREVGLAEARARFGRLLEQGLAGAPEVAVTTVDLGGGLTADRYAPARAEGATVVLLHGGGWTVGTAAEYAGLAARLCAGLSAVVLAVEHRRAPEHPFPAAVEDAVAAVRWAQVHADDTGRVVVAGDSGGGNLAAVVCRELREAGEPQPALQLLLYPSVGAGIDWPSVAAFGRSPFLPLADMGWYTRNYLPEGTPLTDPRVSPLEEPDLGGLAPALLVTAECDALRDSGRAYGRALAAAGVPVTALDLPAVPHGFAHLVALDPTCASALDQVLTAARGLSVFG